MQVLTPSGVATLVQVYTTAVVTKHSEVPTFRAWSPGEITPLHIMKFFPDMTPATRSDIRGPGFIPPLV